MPAKFMVCTNLSVLSLMSMTAPPKSLSLSHNAVTPFNAAPPMKLPNAAALLVAFWNAFTASSLLPVMRTDMIALCAIGFLHSFGFVLQYLHRRRPIQFACLLPPLPRGAAEIAGQQARETA